MKHIICFLSMLISLQGFASVSEKVEFISHDTKLAGTIVFPDDQEIKAAVIFVHGSGKQSRFLQGAERFAKDGIAALVYDKRGVGESGGEYESKYSVSEDNLNLLADDALAAFETLSNHPKLKNVPLGMTGISQAGWIVPLAAQKTQHLDFIVLWSGPISKVSEEDIFSKYTRDLDTKMVPSYAEAVNARQSPYRWPAFLGKDTDPSESLRKLDVSGLWVFGKQDGSVPVDLSIQNLERLLKDGHAYEYILFSNAGHNNMPVSFSAVNEWILRTTSSNLP